MTDLRNSITVDMQGNVERQAQRYEKSLQDLSNKGSRHLSRLRLAGGAAFRGIDRMGNRFTALATGAAAVATTRQLIGMEERFARLGIQANSDAAAIEKLKQQIFSISQQPDIRIDPSQLTGAIEEIIEKTGDLDYARRNIEGLALGISATGAEGGAIGGIAAEFQKMGIEVNDALSILVTQGKAGAFTLQNLASLGPRVVTAYTALGREGVPAIREMGAALQMIRQGTGSSEQAATAWEALLRTFKDADKLKILKGSGIKVFEDDQEKVLRPINELMKEIVATADGSSVRLSRVFDAEALRAFNTAITEYNNTGGIASLDRFLNVQADSNLLLTDSARVASTAAGAMRYLGAAWTQFADNNLTAPITAIADTLSDLDPEQVQKYFETAATGVKVLAGVIVATKLVGMATSMATGFNAMRNVGKGGGALGAAANLAPIPVFVVNGMGGDWKKQMGRVTTGGVAGATAGAAGGVGGMAKLGLYGLALGGGYAGGRGANWLLDQVMGEGWTAERFQRAAGVLGNDTFRAQFEAQDAAAAMERKLAERMEQERNTNGRLVNSETMVRIMLDGPGADRARVTDVSNNSVEVEGAVGGSL